MFTVVICRNKNRTRCVLFVLSLKRAVCTAFTVAIRRNKKRIATLRIYFLKPKIIEQVLNFKF